MDFSTKNTKEHEGTRRKNDLLFREATSQCFRYKVGYQNPMNADELKARTKQFGLRVMNLVDVLPGTTTGREANRGRC